MTDTKAMQEGVAAHRDMEAYCKADLALATDFAEIEKRVLAWTLNLRPILRRVLPAGKRLSTALAYGMSRERAAKQFPFSYFVWKIVPQKDPWRAGGYTGYAKGPTDWLHSGELVFSKTGRWPSSQYAKSNAPKTYGGKLTDNLVQARGSKLYGLEDIDAKLPDGTFLQFKHGEPGPTGARKSQIDVYKQAAARLMDDAQKFEGDPHAALYAQYGEGPKED